MPDEMSDDLSDEYDFDYTKAKPNRFATSHGSLKSGGRVFTLNRKWLRDSRRRKKSTACSKRCSKRCLHHPRRLPNRKDLISRNLIGKPCRLKFLTC